MVKTPGFWVVAVILVVATAAFSSLRKAVKPIAAKVPGNDVQ